MTRNLLFVRLEYLYYLNSAIGIFLGVNHSKSLETTTERTKGEVCSFYLSFFVG